MQRGRESSWMVAKTDLRTHTPIILSTLSDDTIPRVDSENCTICQKHVSCKYCTSQMFDQN